MGGGASMALDENDDPMFAYLAVPATLDGGSRGSCNPGGGDVSGCDALYFTRWDPCAGAFTPPVIIDPSVNYYGGSAGVLDYAGEITACQQVTNIAYDRTTHEIGIVYIKTQSFDGWSGDVDTIFLASHPADAGSFFTYQISDNTPSGVQGGASAADAPNIAMNAGNVYVTYASGEAYGPCPGSGGALGCQDFLTSTAGMWISPDAGPGFGVPDSGPVPHYFSYQLIPWLDGGFDGWATPRIDSNSIAVDSSGRPAVAFFQGYDGTATLLYWRSDMTDAVKVTDSQGQGDDNVAVSMAFEGTKPRMAALLGTPTNTDGDLISVASNDGVTWNAPVLLTLSGNAGDVVGLAVDSAGDEVVVSPWIASANDPQQVDAGCDSTFPFVGRSSDDGADWSGCGFSGPQLSYGQAPAVNAAYGQSRLAGKFVMSMHSQNLDGSWGITYWQDP
jgi:hypothetical protein